MSDSVQQEMDSVISAWESALNTIRQRKQELQAQLAGAAPRAQAVGVLRSFYETVNAVKDKLNQPTSVERGQVEASTAAASSAPATPAANKTLAEILVPENPVAVPSIPSTPECSEHFAATVEPESGSRSETQLDQSATPGPSPSTAAVIAAADTTYTPSPSVSIDTQSQEVINNNDDDDKGKNRPINTTPTKTTAQASGNNNINNINKSGSGSIPSKKDNIVNIKGKGKATAQSPSPSPDPFSAKTMDKITKTIRGNRFGARLPLIKPVSVLNFARATGTPFGRSVSGPSRLEQQQRAVTPEAMPEVEEESESSVYLSLMESDRGLSATPDASSTPGPAFARAAAVSAGAGAVDSPTPMVGKEQEQEELIAGADEGEGNAEVVDGKGEGETATFATAIGGSSSNGESGSGSGSNRDIVYSIEEVRGGDMNETQGSSNNVVEGTGENKTSITPTKTTTTQASGVGSIISKKDLKGKGKGKGNARSRSSSPGSPSPKNDNHKIVKNSKNKAAKSLQKNKENQPFSKHSGSLSVASSSKTAASNNDVNNNNNNKPTNNDKIQDEIVVKGPLLKGKGKTIDTPTPAPTTTITIDVDVHDMARVIDGTTATTGASASNINNVVDKTSKSASNSAISSSNTGNNNNNNNNNKASGSGRGTLPSKKDPKGKGKAIFPPPSLLPPPSTSTADPYVAPRSAVTPTTTADPSSPKTTKGDKVTKCPAARRRERKTIKRSVAKRGAHWAFKLEAPFALSTDDVEANRDKWFILCCTAHNCRSPNFGGKHPFRERRAVAHYAPPPSGDLDGSGAEEKAAGGRNSCLMEVDKDEREGMDVDVDVDVDEDGDGDVEMTEAEIFEKFGMEIVPDQKRWPVDEKWAMNHNTDLCKKKRSEEREGMLAEL